MHKIPADRSNLNKCWAHWNRGSGKTGRSETMMRECIPGLGMINASANALPRPNLSVQRPNRSGIATHWVEVTVGGMRGRQLQCLVLARRFGRLFHFHQRLNLCSVFAPFIIYAPLSYWKCIANCHFECSVKRSSAVNPVDPAYQALTRRCWARDCQLWSEQWDDPTRAKCLATHRV